jgi:tape measure domain-containing protein
MAEDLQLSVGIGGEKAFMAAINNMTNAVNGLTGQVDKLGKEGEQAGQQVGRAGISMGDAFKMAGVSMGLDAIVSGVMNLGKAAINSAVEYEQLSVSLGVLLGDASKVPAVLGEWKKFSDATPFEPEQVNKAGKALLAFGFESEALVPLMTKIGDVAAGTGKDFNELAVIYGKARVAGTLMSEDINQLTEAGIPIMEELAAVLGTSTDKVKKMASEGKITFPLFEQAFGRLTGEGGKFGGMMDKLSTTTGGILSTLKGEFDGFLRTIGEAFLPIIKDLALGAMPLLKAAMVLIQPVLNAISLAFQALKNFITPLIPPLSAIWDAFGRIREAMAPLVDAIFPGLNNQFGILDLIVKPIAFILEGVATVLGYVADAVVYVIDAWDRFAANSPKIAAAIEYIVFPLKAAVSAVEKFGDAWDYVFGDGGDSVGGLAQKSQSYISQLAKVAGQEFGASSQQVIAFSKTLKAAEFAGKSQGDALILLKEKFAAFMEAQKKVTKTTTTNGDATNNAAGSINALQEQLKLLKEQYEAVGSAAKRVEIGKQIQDLEAQMEVMRKQGEEIKNITYATKTATDGFGKFAMATGDMTRPADGMQSMMDMLMAMPLELETTTTAWERFSAKVGEEGMAKLKEGINQIKGAFRDFGISAVESFGYAIGAGESAGAAFKKLVMGLMVEVPKLAGMALLNAAATTPGPQALPMAIAGLALIGLSGLLGGLASKADQDTAAMNNMMDELPSGATGAGGVGGIGGLGGFSAGNQVQPIQVNVNAEMDGVQLGGLFRRVTNNYNKTVVKQF